MLFHTHLIIGFICGSILLNFFGISENQFLVFVLSSILIDIDHVFYFAYMFFRLPLNDLIAHCKNLQKEKIPKFYVFHTFAFLLCLIVLSFFDSMFFFVFAGVLLHLSMDAISYVMHYKNFSFLKHWSLVWYFQKFISRR